MSSLEAICDHVKCNRRAAISLTYKGQIIYLCKEHFNKLQEVLYLIAMRHGSSNIEQALVRVRSGRVKIEVQ